MTLIQYDLILTWLDQQRLNFQIRLHSQILRIGISVYHFAGHNSIYGTPLIHFPLGLLPVLWPRLPVSRVFSPWSLHTIIEWSFYNVEKKSYYSSAWKYFLTSKVYTLDLTNSFTLFSFEKWTLCPYGIMLGRDLSLLHRILIEAGFACQALLISLPSHCASGSLCLLDYLGSNLSNYLGFLAWSFLQMPSLSFSSGLSYCTMTYFLNFHWKKAR